MQVISFIINCDLCDLNLAVDVLQMMIGKLNHNLPHRLSFKLRESVVALPYADDTAIIANSDEETLISLKIILRMFTAISGLHINYEISMWIPINMQEEVCIRANLILGCCQSQFPTIYLRMPLTIRKPRRDLFMPLIKQFKSKLES